MDLLAFGEGLIDADEGLEAVFDHRGLDGRSLQYHLVAGIGHLRPLLRYPGHPTLPHNLALGLPSR